MSAAFQYAVRDLETVQQALASIPMQKRTCLQAGACLGVFPEFLATQFQAVYAFEPDPSLFRKAVIYAKQTNVVWFNGALGARKGMVRTECKRRDGSNRPSHAGLTHVISDNEFGIIPIIRIDDLALPNLDLLCLDIEGSEHDALTGALQTIERCRPVIIIEVNKQAQHSGLTEEQLRQFVIKLGYKFKFRNHSDEVFVSC